MGEAHSVDRSLIAGDKWFIFEYKKRSNGDIIYQFSSSIFGGGTTGCYGEPELEEILKYKRKIIEHIIPAGNVLIHPDLLELWNSI